MKKKSHLFLTCLVTISLFSCSEQEKPTQLESILDKIEKNNGDDINIDDLIESMEDEKGSYTVSLPKGKFKITFPVLNVKETSTIQLIDNEEIEIFHYTANMQGKDDVNLGYQLDYIFFPEIKSDEDINQLFNVQRDYVLSATNSILEFEKIIEKNDAPGRHMYITVDESEIKINHKMFFKNGIFYKLSVVTPEGNLFNKSISRFFNSFKIVD